MAEHSGAVAILTVRGPWPLLTVMPKNTCMEIHA
jgi:hypothetical protein